MKKIFIMSLITLWSCAYGADASVASSGETIPSPGSDDAVRYETFSRSLTVEQKEIMQNLGWDKGPSWYSLAASGAWVAGSIATMLVLGKVLKRDKKARELKLKKEQMAQQGPQINPLLQMMRMMQMQQGGMEGMPDLGEDGMQLIKSDQQPDEVPTWNPKHLLSPALRKFCQVSLWVARGVFAWALLSFGDKCRDWWQGTTARAAVRASINEHLIFFQKLQPDAAQGDEFMAKLDLALLARAHGINRGNLPAVRDVAEHRNTTYKAKVDSFTRMLTKAQELEQHALCKADASGLTLGWLRYMFGGTKQLAHAITTP